MPGRKLWRVYQLFRQEDIWWPWHQKAVLHAPPLFDLLNPITGTKLVIDYCTYFIHLKSSNYHREYCPAMRMLRRRQMHIMWMIQ